MDGQNTINITVLIAGRPYPLKVRESDEPAIRVLVKEINDKFNSFQQSYAKKDKQDILAMILLTYAVDLQKLRNNVTIDHNISERLTKLEDILSELLSA